MRVCDSKSRLALLSSTVGAVTAEGLNRGLLSLDKRLDACEAQLLFMCKAAPARDFDVVEALCDMLIRQQSASHEEVLEALAAVLPNPLTAAPRVPAAGAAGPAGAAGAAPAPANRLNINKPMKPFTLLPSHTPTEFKHWSKL